MAYVHESSLGREPLYALVTLEFGKHEGEVFAVPRAPRVDSADESFFLHPVIRVFSNGLFVREHHLLENLFGEWTDPLVHRRPLRDFMTDILADAAKTKALLRFTDNAPTGP